MYVIFLIYDSNIRLILFAVVADNEYDYVMYACYDYYFLKRFDYGGEMLVITIL